MACQPQAGEKPEHVQEIGGYDVGRTCTHQTGRSVPEVASSVSWVERFPETAVRYVYLKTRVGTRRATYQPANSNEVVPLPRTVEV